MSPNLGSVGMAKKLRAFAIALAAAIGITLGATAPAMATDTAISGSTSWGPCNWYTSNNVRYASGTVNYVQAKIADTGKLGVKMRIKNEYTGGVSSTQYFPSGSFLVFGAASNFKAFRMQFTCRDERDCGVFTCDRPDTDFYGTLRY